MIKVDDLVAAVDQRQKDDQQRARDNAKFAQEQNQRAQISTTVSQEHSQDREQMKNMATHEDVGKVSETLNKLVLTTFVQQQDKWEGLITTLVTLTERLQAQLDRAGKEIPNAQGKVGTELIQGLQKIADSIKIIKIETEQDNSRALQKITEALQNIDFTPQITVPQPKVTVKAADVTVDLSPIQKQLTELNSTVKELASKEEQEPTDFTPLVMEMTSVKDAIQNIQFPVPNFIQDPFITYKTADVDDAGTTRYYGFIDPGGRWYIMQENTIAGTYRYTAGGGHGTGTDYPSNWTGRASLTYDYLSLVQL